MKRIKFKKSIIIVISIVMMLLMAGCSSDYVGTYIGLSSNATLILNEDQTFTYDESNAFNKAHFDGDYEVDGNQIIIHFKKNVVLYAEIQDDGGLYITSDNSKWSSEYFDRV